MLKACLNHGRGYISDSDTGVNQNYYLNSGTWYRTLSPKRIWKNGDAYQINVHNDGRLYSNNVEIAGGGVRSVVSLKTGTIYASRDGTAANPY